MAKAHSSRKRPARRTRTNSPSPESSVATGASPNQSDSTEVLGRWSDGLALVETAYGAIRNAQVNEALISSGLLTLQRGIDELQSAYTDFDLALSQGRL